MYAFSLEEYESNIGDAFRVFEGVAYQFLVGSYVDQGGAVSFCGGSGCEFAIGIGGAEGVWRETQVIPDGPLAFIDVVFSHPGNYSSLNVSMTHIDLGWTGVDTNNVNNTFLSLGKDIIVVGRPSATVSFANTTTVGAATAIHVTVTDVGIGATNETLHTVSLSPDSHLWPTLGTNEILNAVASTRIVTFDVFFQHAHLLDGNATVFTLTHTVVSSLGGSRSSVLPDTLTVFPVPLCDAVWRPALASGPALRQTLTEASGTGYVALSASVRTGTGAPAFAWNITLDVDGTTLLQTTDPAHALNLTQTPHTAGGVLSATVVATDASGVDAHCAAQLSLVPVPVPQLTAASPTSVGAPLRVSASVADGTPPFAYTWQVRRRADGVLVDNTTTTTSARTAAWRPVAAEDWLTAAATSTVDVWLEVRDASLATAAAAAAVVTVVPGPEVAWIAHAATASWTHSAPLNATALITGGVAPFNVSWALWDASASAVVRAIGHATHPTAAAAHTVWWQSTDVGATYTLAARVSDAAGASSPWHVNATAITIRRPPVITIALADNRTSAGASLAVAITGDAATGTGSPWETTLWLRDLSDGAPVAALGSFAAGPASTVVVVTIPPGVAPANAARVEVAAVAVDVSGASSAVAAAFLDVEPALTGVPQWPVAVTASANGTQVVVPAGWLAGGLAPVAVAWVVTKDATGDVHTAVNASAATPLSVTWTLGDLEGGNHTAYTLVATATDAAGSILQVVLPTVLHPPPTIQSVAAPSGVAAGGIASLSADIRNGLPPFAHRWRWVSHDNVAASFDATGSGLGPSDTLSWRVPLSALGDLQGAGPFAFNVSLEVSDVWAVTAVAPPLVVWVHPAVAGTAAFSPPLALVGDTVTLQLGAISGGFLGSADAVYRVWWTLAHADESGVIRTPFGNTTVAPSQASADTAAETTFTVLPTDISSAATVTAVVCDPTDACTAVAAPGTLTLEAATGNLAPPSSGDGLSSTATWVIIACAAVVACCLLAAIVLLFRRRNKRRQPASPGKKPEMGMATFARYGDPDGTTTTSSGSATATWSSSSSSMSSTFPTSSTDDLDPLSGIWGAVDDALVEAAAYAKDSEKVNPDVARETRATLAAVEAMLDEAVPNPHA